MAVCYSELLMQVAISWEPVAPSQLAPVSKLRLGFHQVSGQAPSFGDPGRLALPCVRSLPKGLSGSGDPVDVGGWGGLGGAETWKLSLPSPASTSFIFHCESQYTSALKFVLSTSWIPQTERQGNILSYVQYQIIIYIYILIILICN